MKRKPSPQDLTQQEYRTFITTGALYGVIVFIVLLINLQVGDFPPGLKTRVSMIALGGGLYVSAYSAFLATLRHWRGFVNWINAAMSGLGLLALAVILPFELIIYYRLIALFTIISISVLADRPTIMLVLAIGFFAPSLIWLAQADSLQRAAENIGLSVAGIIISETMIRIQNVARQQIHRLETINTFSRQVASTLNREEILSLLNSAIPMAVAADSYYVGIQEGDEVYIPLFYDDGEYFNEGRVSIEGTLSGWVIKNNRELFLPDLRAPLDLPGVSVVVAGKDKESLSWIGVPMSASRFKGLIALASYQPNAFNRGDMELLANLSQHVALALENALIHEEAEQRSRIDQMTGVFNHGAFLATLQKMADELQAANQPLSLIMLDVDHFKQYNDTYGHLVGDRVLNLLCDTVRAHIKNTDAVGRWGGEEFIIALPNANGQQAFYIAERIRKTMNEMKVPGRVGDPIPAPTVSQGVAEFPAERSAIFDLIDLADKRLYVAKGRGRNQIEPNELFWTSTR